MRKGFLPHAAFFFEKSSPTDLSPKEAGIILPLVLSHSSPRRAQAQQRYPLSHGYLFEGPQGNVSSLNRSALALADEQKRRAQTNRRILRH